MRYSFMAVAIISTLSLTACNRSADSNSSTESTASAQSSAASTQRANAASAENVSMNITGAGASFPQPIYAKWSADYNRLLA